MVQQIRDGFGFDGLFNNITIWDIQQILLIHQLCVEIKFLDVLQGKGASQADRNGYEEMNIFRLFIILTIPIKITISSNHSCNQSICAISLPPTLITRHQYSNKPTFQPNCHHFHSHTFTAIATLQIAKQLHHQC